MESGLLGKKFTVPGIIERLSSTIVSWEAFIQDDWRLLWVWPWIKMGIDKIKRKIKKKVFTDSSGEVKNDILGILFFKLNLKMGLFYPIPMAFIHN